MGNYKPNTLRAWNYPEQCDICGDRWWHSAMQWSSPNVKNGKQYRACPDCWDPYHEGNEVKLVKEQRSVPVSRPLKLDDDGPEYDEKTTTEHLTWYTN